MNIISVTTFDKVTELRSRAVPVVAVDLGFSGRNPTTGYADSLPTSPQNGVGLTFGKAVSKTAESAAQAGEIVLILEAPLCGKFDGGNPVARGSFEEASSGIPPKNWNIGAGAAVALAAIHFLNLLQTALAGKNVAIHLLEGFVSGANKPVNPSNKSKVEAKAEQHGLDASFLVTSFADSAGHCFIKLPDNPDILPTTKILDPQSDFAPPLILKPEPHDS